LLVDQLRQDDRVAIVVYAGNAGLVLPSTNGSEKTKIKDRSAHWRQCSQRVRRNKMAYKIAKQNFVKRWKQPGDPLHGLVILMWREQ